MASDKKKSNKRSVSRIVLEILTALFVLSFVILFSLYIALSHFGEYFIKGFLQNKIHKTSNGLYEINFDKFRYNIFTGQATVTDFKLIPNEELYQELKKEGKAKSSLYGLSYEKLVLKSLDIKQIYFERIIHLREIELNKPVINFVAYPDTIHKKKEKFKRIYKDIYPMMSIFFSEVKIDSISVNDGSFTGKQTIKSGQINEGEYLFSAILRDFDLNAFQYYKQDRVFYSKDIELIIKNFKYSLADSLYFLHADEVGFSLIGSRLFGKELTLTPNLTEKRVAASRAGQLFQIYLPEFSIDDVDIFKAMLDKEIWINAIEIEDLSVKVFKHRNPEDPVRHRAKKKITIANLFTVFDNKIRSFRIDTFSLKNASFDYFASIRDPYPEVNISKADVQFHQFQLDSLAHLDTTKILYAKDIELDLTNFTLALEDKLHELRAYKVKVNTRKSSIEVLNTLLSISKHQDETVRYKSNSFYHLMFPEVRFYQVDISKMFNFRRLNFAKLSVLEPDLDIIQYRGKEPPSDSAEKKTTFITKLNIIPHLVSPYMKSLRAGSVEISNGKIRFLDKTRGQQDERISGLIDLYLTGIDVDSLKWQDQKEILGKLDLDLQARDFRYNSRDDQHQVSFNEFYFNTLAANLEVKDLTYLADITGKSKLDTIKEEMSIRVEALDVNGFDHMNWIRTRHFYAKHIRLDKPRVFIHLNKKTKKKHQQRALFEVIHEVVNRIELEQLNINQGTLDMIQRHHEKPGCIRLKNFDYQLSGFLMDLSGWDKGIKIFRYDHLSFKLDTTAPLILDSAYTINFSRFLSDSYPPDLAIKDLRVAPMKRPNQKTPPPVEIDLSIPSLQINDLNLERVLFDKELAIGSIDIKEPEVTLVRQESKKSHPDKKKRQFTHPEIHSPFNKMTISRLNLDKGKINYINYIDHRDTTTTTLSLDNIYAMIKGFSYDTSDQFPDQSAIFHCQDIDLRTGGYAMVTKDSMNTISFAGLHLSTQQSILEIDSFALTPNYSDFGYSRKLGYQTDRMEIQTGTIKLERLNFKRLLNEKRLHVGLIAIDWLSLDDYRDKRVKFPYWKRPPMIQQAIRNITFPMDIDSLLLTNGEVTYREQTEQEPGMIFFNQMHFLAKGFTTDSLMISEGDELVAGGSVYMMGKAKMEGEFRFPMQSPTDTFYFNGKTGRVDMTLFNPMVSKVAPVKIKSGVVDSVNIHWMRGNNTYATGILDLYYQGLQIELLHVKKNFLNKVGTDIMQILVNMAVPQENPGYFGIHRRGYIWNHRNEEKGYFNFFWKSILEGLKSSEGINSKEQKAFKKEYKQEMKSQKK